MTSLPMGATASCVCFLRMPFGLKSAAEVFQKAMDRLIEDYPCQNVVDDILIWGATESEHDAKLIKVLNRAREIGLQLKVKSASLRFKRSNMWDISLVRKV